MKDEKKTLDFPESFFLSLYFLSATCCATDLWILYFRAGTFSIKWISERKASLTDSESEKYSSTSGASNIVPSASV
jgi:hypothetical protein